MKINRVVVTGTGCVTPLGNNVHETWKGIKEKTIGYSKLENLPETIQAKYFGLVKTDKKDFKKIPVHLRRAMPRFAKNAFLAAMEAVKCAFSTEQIQEYYDPFDCGVIIGTGWGGLDEAFDAHDQIRQYGIGHPLGSLETMPNIATATCSMYWNLRGYQNTMVAACATGNLAIGEAYQKIRYGDAKMMLAGGAEALISNTNIWNVDILGALSKEQDKAENACCPFDIKRSGFILSEGAAVICLEEYESAKRRGAKILGEVIGYGSYSDARDFTAPAEDLEARSRSIARALQDANLSPGDIDYINAHGTSTPLNDLNETETIKKVFGKHAYDISISSTKSYVGHLIAASGSFETIVCVNAINDSFVPATINLNDPDPKCDLNYTPNDHLQKEVNIALNLSFGFGGANAALIVRKLNL